MNARTKSSQRGISLVELMVGVTIGLITALLMLQFALFYDAQKKGNTGGADAQSSGAIAMYSIETDIRLGGYGLASLDTFYCTLQSSRTFNGRRFVPVMIVPDGTSASATTNPLGIPPGDSGSDIVAVMYGNTVSTPEGVPLSGVSGTTGYSFGKNVTGFTVGDFALVAQAGQNCTLGQIATVASPSITLDHASTGTTYSANNGLVYNIGSAGLTMRVYAIRSGNLTVCDFWSSNCADASLVGDAAVWVPIASNIVGLRAQYGWDTTATPDMRVDAYCRSRLTVAAPNCPVPDAGATAPNTACDWSRIATLRLALVSRSAEIARDGVNVSDATITLWPTVVANLSNVPLTTGPVFTVPSQRYRYKVLETIVPLRNVVWLGGQSGC